MEKRRAFALAFKQIRSARGLTQEDFSSVSSRTYISRLERGMQNPTLEKIELLSQAMEVHPLTLLSLMFSLAENQSNLKDLFNSIEHELTSILEEK